MPPVEIWVDGLTQSCIYMTMAFGMVLVFSILGILNWTHGQFYMFGALVVYYSVTAMGIPFLISLLISAVVVGALGILVEKLIIERVNVPVYGPLYVGVATISLIFFFEGAASMLFGMQDKGLKSVFPGVFDFGHFSISYQKIGVIIFTIVIMGTMYFVLNRTKIGFAIRAVEQEPVAANLYGINVKQISRIVMGIGCGLAAMAGGMMAPIYPIKPFMGSYPMIMSLLAIVIGGIGSLTGAIVGGLILGFLHSVITYKISYYSEVVLFALVILILLFRPQGLFGASLK
jgi:branched-chain amino acid transport system permease protein